MEFDLKGSAISANDILDIELKNYETVGANKYSYKYKWKTNFISINEIIIHILHFKRLIATGSVPLSLLFNANTTKLQVELKDLHNAKLENVFFIS